MISRLLYNFYISSHQERWLEKDALWCQQLSRLWASNKLYNPRCAVCTFRFPPPTSVAIKKLHVVRALGFFSELIFPGFEKLKAHWLQPDDSRFAISQQPVAMVTPAQWRPDAASLKYMIHPPFTKHQCFLCCCHHKPAWCLLLVPPSATEISACLEQHGGNDRSGLFVHMCVLAILQMELYLHHQTTFSQIAARSGICIYEQSIQTDSSRKAVMVWLMCPWRDDSKYWGKKVRRWWRWR